jgi:hypothetical protein
MVKAHEKWAFGFGRYRSMIQPESRGDGHSAGVIKPPAANLPALANSSDGRFEQFAVLHKPL